MLCEFDRSYLRSAGDTDVVGCSKKLGQMLENKMGTSTTLWKEVEDSFVSNAVGGNANVTAAKL